MACQPFSAVDTHSKVEPFLAAVIRSYLRCKVPVLSEITYTQPWEFDFLGEVLLYAHPYWYLFAQTLCASLVCSTLAVLALLISVKVPDRLATGFAPLILYYLFFVRIGDHKSTILVASGLSVNWLSHRYNWNRYANYGYASDNSHFESSDIYFCC